MPRTAASGGRRRPARAHASATTWRFRSSWCLYVACWSWQPPHAPKYGHGAATRCGDGPRTHGAARGVHLQHASRASRRLEDVANGLLEVPFVVGRGAGRPVALGVVEVSKNLERLLAFEHQQDLGEVVARGGGDVGVLAVSEL